MALTTSFYSNFESLPENWDEVIGCHNILLSSSYFRVLLESQPSNMDCYFVGIYQDTQLVGGAIIQYLSFLKHSTFQRNKLWCEAKNFFGKRFTREVLILGNNMLTGQNGFHFDLKKISTENAIEALEHIVEKATQQIKKPSLIIYKDYRQSITRHFETEQYKNYFKFSVQPNMILKLNKNWENFEDYLASFSTKYRIRAKSARKKASNILKRELDERLVKKYHREINALYHNVAENAVFNTFFLAENHFEALVKYLSPNFKIFGYFLNEKLIGFYTLILNNQDVDTYFLGYEKDLQKQYQLYLNMLLDMVEYGITHQFEKIVFGRTALEIKSTIGAKPTPIFGFIKHTNSFINPFVKSIFPRLEPKMEWVQRNPFKE